MGGGEAEPGQGRGGAWTGAGAGGRGGAWLGLSGGKGRWGPERRGVWVTFRRIPAGGAALGKHVGQSHQSGSRPRIVGPRLVAEGPP